MLGPVITLPQRSTRARYAQRGHWRQIAPALDTEVDEWIQQARVHFPVDQRVGHGWLAPDGEFIHVHEHLIWGMR